VSLPAGCRRRSNRRGARRAGRVRPGISDRTLECRCASAPSEGTEPEQGCSRQEGAWCVRVCVLVCTCIFVCMCVSEREREKEIKGECVRVCEKERERESVCVCL